MWALAGVNLNSVSTPRGLKVGDTLIQIFDLYGKPTSIQKYDSNKKFIELIYEADNSLSFVLDETVSRIQYIFIDYNMLQSVIDQGI